MEASANDTGCSGAGNGPSESSLTEAGAKPLVSPSARHWLPTTVLQSVQAAITECHRLSGL